MNDLIYSDDPTSNTNRFSVYEDFYRHNSLTKSEQISFRYYYTKFSRVATSRFKWDFKDNKLKHLSRVIESNLWYYGDCIVFNHPLAGWVCTPCIKQSWDVNNYPNKFKPRYEIAETIGITNYEPTLNRYDMNGEFNDKTDCIYITDTTNYLYRSRFCIPLIYDLMDIKETIRTQIFNQNTPLMAIAKNQKDKQKIKFFIEKIGKHKIYVTDDDLTNNLKVLDLNAPFNIEPLTNYMHEIENEILEYLNVDCSQIFQKKERMITSEVESNNELLSSLYYDCYSPRDYAKECMKKAKIDVELKYILSSTDVTGNPEPNNNGGAKDGKETEGN